MENLYTIKTCKLFKNKLKNWNNFTKKAHTKTKKEKDEFYKFIVLNELRFPKLLAIILQLVYKLNYFEKARAHEAEICKYSIE